MDDARTNPEFAPQTGVPDPWRQRKGSRGAWIAVTFIVAALVVTVAIIQGAYHRSKNIPVLPEPRKVATSSPAPAELSLSFREVAKAVKPAVVYINIVENASAE